MTSVAVERPQRRESAAAHFEPRPGWLRGLFATALVVAGVGIVLRAWPDLPSPAVFLLLAVVYASLSGGLVVGLASAGACLAYSAVSLGGADGLLDMDAQGRIRLAMLAVALPSGAAMSALLSRRSQHPSLAPVHERAVADPSRDASDEFAAAVLNSLPAHIAVLDEEGRIVAVNHAWEQFARGNGAPDLAGCGLGSNYLEVCRRARNCGAGCNGGSADADEAFDGIIDVMRGRRPHFAMEYPCDAPTEQRWFLLSVTPLHAADRDAAAAAPTPATPASATIPRRERSGVVVSHFDITARKKVEQTITRLLRQIDEQRRRVQEVLDHVPAVVFEAYANPDASVDRVNFVNNHVERMLGYSAQQWLALPELWLDAVHADDRERVRAETSAVLARGSGASEFRWTTRDGRTLWVEAHCRAIRDPLSGNAVGLRGVITDISRLKRAQQALRRRAAAVVRVARQLQRSNEELDQFAYVTSHDLRAPLRGIANLSRWIEEDLGEAFPPEARRQMDLLRGRVHRMEALIDGILQYSRVGRVRIAPQAVDVAALVREVVDLLSPPPQFVVEVAPDMPSVQAERLRLQQVFMNLIGNALKHHDKPQGRIRVGCRDTDGEFYEFSVSDDGPGIAPQYHDKVFVMFQTLQARDKVEGTGVGLSLVKKIVEQQGGSIRLRSAEGQGATFSFTWPKRITLKGATAR